MTPIELLQKELKVLKKCKSKSIESFKKGDITEELHNKHLMNLEPKIKDYENAVYTLTHEQK